MKIEGSETFEVRDRRGGFLWVPNKIFDRFSKQLNSTSFMLYLALCRLANNVTQQCFPSQSYLAEMIGIDERTVRRAMDELISTGLIARIKNGRHYDYTLLATPDKMSAIDTGQITPTIPDISDKNTGHQCPTNKTKNKTQEQERSSPISEPNDFCLSNEETSSRRKAKQSDPRHQSFREHLEKFWVWKNPGLPMFSWSSADAKQLSELLKRWPELTGKQFKWWLMNYAESEDITASKTPRQFLPFIHDYASGPRNKYHNPKEEQSA